MHPCVNTFEHRLVAQADGFESTRHDLQSLLQAMDGWFAGLIRDLDLDCLSDRGLRPDSALAMKVQALKLGVQANMQTWAEQRASLAPAQELAHELDDRAIFLVFGKFNSGKSSLCNFLADRFREQGRQVHYFYLDGGQLRQSQAALCEGATETTARLQGVCLGEKLVLLDTPGLHSASAENAALTQRFLHSADAVLWLTSSTSPGQVQELEELAQELRRCKPLLPIVTRSDFIEEDEVEGVIRKVLRNKTDPNRSMQEADVFTRAQEKLRALGTDPALLKVPISVSVHMAREYGQTAAAMEQAGFERLYGALIDIAGPALAYKARKPAQVLVHHLEEDVVGGLHATTLPALAALRQGLRNEIAALQAREAHIVRMAWRNVISDLPRLLGLHAPARDLQAVCKQLSQRVRDALGEQIREQLSDYDLPPTEISEIIPGEGVGYVPVAIGTEKLSEPASDFVMVDYEPLHHALENAVQQQLRQAASVASIHCSRILTGLEAGIERLQNVLDQFAHEIGAIKATI